MVKIKRFGPGIGRRLPREIVLKGIGYPKAELAPQELINLTDEYIEAAVEYADPAVVYRLSSFWVEEPNQVRLADELIIRSERLYDTVKACDGLVVGLITLGADVDKRIKAVSDQDVFGSYLLDVIGSFVLEMVAQQWWQELTAELKQQGFNTSSFVSPGSKVFPLEEQKQIFAFLRPEQIGVSLTASYLMQPSKSLSVVIGYGRNIAQAKYSHDCSACDMTDCLIRGIHLDLSE